MSELKRKIQTSIMEPAAHARRDSYIIGRVTKSDEKNNVCSIEFIDKDGYASNKDNVQVKIHSTGIIDWFPVVGEFVNLKDDGVSVIIESKYENGYITNVRPRTELKADILPTTFGSIFGGTIF